MNEIKIKKVKAKVRYYFPKESWLKSEYYLERIQLDKLIAKLGKGMSIKEIKYCRGPKYPPRPLSMEEFLKWNEFNLKYNVDRKAYKKWKRLSAVNVPFVF